MPTSAELAAQLSSLDQGWNPTDAYNRATTQLGIPDARNRVTALQTALANSENAIKAVDPSVTGRTQGSLVTEAQRQRLVSMERAPLTDQYNTQTTNYNKENENLGKLTDQAQQQFSMEESGYKSKRQALADQISFAQSQEEIARQAAAARLTGGGRSSSGGSSSSRSSGGSKAKGSSGGAAVDPAKDFLGYISNQFKAAGKNPSRQSQDAWVNAWFKQNNVSQAARQTYWNLINKTYKRPDDPKKDWLYRK